MTRSNAIKGRPTRFAYLSNGSATMLSVEQYWSTHSEYMSLTGCILNIMFRDAQIL